MIARIAIIIAAAVLSTAALADDNSAKQIAAIPSLVQQRNGALDGLAVCTGETETLRKQLAEAQAELAKLKPKEDEK